LPWLFSIARRVRVDNYRKRRRASREIGIDGLPELPARESAAAAGPQFSELTAPLPPGQRAVLSMLKEEGLSIEEIARATLSTPAAVKQKAHRAYARLRTLLDTAGFPATRKASAP
jgi:RNA polymerase sigma-70 factor (ECF subfamily)